MIKFNFMILFMAVFAVSISAVAMQQAEAQVSSDTHFRYTHMTWVQTPGTNEVTFTGSHAWRTCFSGAETIGTIHACGTLNFGDGMSTTYYVEIAVDNNVGDGFIFGEIVDVNGDPIKHTYASAGPFTAFFDDCCRISTLENAPDGDFRVETVVDMNNGNTQAPTSSLPPIVLCGLAGCQFFVPSIDGDAGDTQMFRQSTGAESGIGDQANYMIDSNTGLLTFDGTGHLPLMLGDQFALSVAVLEKDSQGTEIGRVTVDFLIEITDQVPPNFVHPPTPDDDTMFMVNVGDTLDFDVKCLDDDGDEVTITGFQLPPGSTFPNGQSGTPMVTSAFSFTPAAPGVFAMTFICTDENGGQTLPLAITIQAKAPITVGGEFLPIDSAALLVAGAQTNAVWMLSALAVIGSVAFGALYITSKRD